MQKIALTLGIAALASSVALAAKPVLRVNGDEISDLDVSLAERAVAAQMGGSQAPKEMVLRNAVDQLIGRTLVLQAAREAGITVDAKEVAAAMAQQKQQIGGPEAFAKAISQAGLTEEQLTAMERDRLTVQKYVEKDLMAKAGASDQELRAYYDAHPSEFKHPEQVKLRMILMMVKQGADQAQQDAAKSRADLALKRVKAGEEFAKVAQEVSEDPTSKSRGGEIGWVRKGLLLPELESAVWTLKAGETSAVLQSKYGYHIFKVDERRAEGASSFDEVKGSLTAYLRNQKVDESLRLLVTNRRTTAKIEALDPSIKAALEPPAPPPAAGAKSAPGGAAGTGEKASPAPTPVKDVPKKP
jgi:peptidyl-prolyl cis-trans isomerase C